RGIMYPHRDNIGKPTLAIRVHRSTAEKLLVAKGQNPVKPYFLRRDILMKRLNVVQCREDILQ
ncbi:hypothetical protein H4R33_007173, partial [Dimargaris cristalligena]